MKRFTQFLQATLACVMLVGLIFSIPIVMASTPIHLDISFTGATSSAAWQHSAGEPVVISP